MRNSLKSPAKGRSSVVTAPLISHKEDVSPAENHLVDARRQRKDVDQQLQTLTNRISFLLAEEAKMDRNIMSAQQRLQEELARQSTARDADEEMCSTAREILEKLTGSSGRKGVVSTPPTPGKANAVANAASIVPPPRTPSASRRPVRKPPGSPPLPEPTTNTQPPPSTSDPGAGREQPSPVGASSARQPIRKPSASLVPGQPSLPSTSGSPAGLEQPSPRLRASCSIVDRIETGSRASTSSSNRSTSVPRGARQPPAATEQLNGRINGQKSASASAQGSASPAVQASKPSAASAQVSPLAASPRGSNILPKPPPSQTSSITGSPVKGAKRLPPKPTPATVLAAQSNVQSLESTSQSTEPDGQLTADMLRQHEPDRWSRSRDGRASSAGSNHCMQVLEQGADGEVVEELWATLEKTRSASSEHGAGPLPTFETQNVPKVVQLRSTSLRVSATGSNSSAQLVGGSGWGINASAPAVAAATTPLVIDRSDQAVIANDLKRKQKLWKVRKTFGLEPAPLKDSNAAVTEFGAGAWG